MRLIQPNDLVLFQGDSITNAFRLPQEANNAYQLGSGYALMVAGQLLAARPGDGLRFENRGVAGEGIQGLRKRWQIDCLDLHPNVISILVGINDVRVFQEKPLISVEEYARHYRELLAVTRAELPRATIILCEPFVLPVGDVREERTVDVAAQGAIVRQLATEFNALFLPLQAIFTEALDRAPAAYWSYDGVHPNAQGHRLISEAWLRAMGEQ